MFKKIADLLEAGKISQEVANELDKEVSDALKKERDENASWRNKYKELQNTFNEVNNSKNELETQLKTLDERIEKAKQEGKQEVVKQLEAERSEKNALVDKLKSLEGTTKSLRIENALNKELSKYDVIDSEVLAQVFKQNLDVVDDTIKFKDGKDLESGIEEYFESKPHLLKPKGQGGSGVGEDDKSGYSENTFTAKLLKREKG